jgi:hypothetical protein
MAIGASTKLAKRKGVTKHMIKKEGFFTLLINSLLMISGKLPKAFILYG